MTATAPVAPQKWSPKDMPWYAWVLPAVILILLVLGVYGWAKGQGSDPNAIAASQKQAAQVGGQQGAAQVLDRLGIGATTSTTAAAPQAHYDYLTCSHPRDEHEVPPCKPIVRWPVTEGAKKMIGYEQGGIAYELDTRQTRDVANQIRAFGTAVEPCDMWINSVVDQGGNFTLTVYTNGDQAPDGASKLFDCSPTGRGTDGTIPTLTS